MARGKLIVIEGGDASGKATQTALLQEQLQSDGVEVATLDFPQYDNQIGTLIGECLRGERGDYMQMDPRVTSTLFAADRFETKPKIEAALAAGKVLILDRYTSASMLHQGAKIADDATRKATIDWIYRLEHEVFDLPKPDAVFYLAVPAEVRAELQKDNLKVIDQAERDIEHQQQADKRSAGILDVYKNTYSIDCMNGEGLRAPTDIASEIYQKVRGITHPNI